MVNAYVVDFSRLDLTEWSVDWQMLFNLNKCKIMHFGYNNPQNTFLLDGHILDTVVGEIWE